MFLEFIDLYIFGRAAYGPISADTTTMTTSESMVWSMSAAWVRAFDAAAITLVPDRLFILKAKHRPAWHVSEEVVVTCL